MKSINSDLYPKGPVLDAVLLLQGFRATARICDVDMAAVVRWAQKGKLPRTEATGETQYAKKMADAHPKISRNKLLSTVYRNAP
jgi:hypothetical protein